MLAIGTKQKAEQTEALIIPDSHCVDYMTGTPARRVGGGEYDWSSLVKCERKVNPPPPEFPFGD